MNGAAHRSALLSALPIPALVVDAGARIALANAHARTLLDQQVEGHAASTLLRQPEVSDAITDTLADRQPRRAEYLVRDGAQEARFGVWCAPIDGSGDILVTFQDITHLEQAGQMRRDFVANVSHELKTPLTALLGFIETLQGAASEDPDARARFLAIMGKEAGRMNRLVSDLLSLSRVESQERIRPVDPVDLKSELQGVLDTLKPLAEREGVVFSADVPHSDVTLPGDRDQLRQILTNLVENAIKYGGAGGKVFVSLSTEAADPELRAPAVRIRVVDTGPGIDSHHLPRLTERFYRADQHRSQMLGGTGLGLAIVKHIVNRHRGRLRIESEQGQGSVFTVILPLTA